ncbi:MAG: TRAP transporter small permease [Spirochaetales bacterium]|nr:TRAP transporter small permease [Spirochaetales bacterium]
MTTKLKALFRIDEIIAGIILICIFTDVMLQVISRLTPGNAIFWTVEMGEILLAALIWMSVGPAVLRNSHVRFDLILIKTPPKIRKYLYVFGNIIFAVFLILISVILVQLMDFYKNHNTVTASLQWNKFYVRIPMLVGSIIGAVRLLIQAWQFASGRLPIPVSEAFAGAENAGGK